MYIYTKYSQPSRRRSLRERRERERASRVALMAAQITCNVAIDARVCRLMTATYCASAARNNKGTGYIVYRGIDSSEKSINILIAIVSNRCENSARKHHPRKRASEPGVSSTDYRGGCHSERVDPCLQRQQDPYTYRYIRGFLLMDFVFSLWSRLVY